MPNLPDGEYCGYLRKSRADLEAEGRGEEETYARHERTLLELASRLGITLTKIYREKPISGERISERPEVIKLLEDVGDEHWKGVLVVEVERLARGDTMDQGIVAQAFKYSNTLIITPARTFDPHDQNDEEYFEFNLFMSRREFKTITRRLQGGRLSSVDEGKYLGSVPPYGYERVKLQGKGYSLEPHPDQAPIVQLIFSLYTHPDPDIRMGTTLIARYLNEDLKVPSAKGTAWIPVTINSILRNITYTGKVRWKTRPLIKKRDSKSRPRLPIEDTIVVKGLHEALVDEETFDEAMRIMSTNSHAPAPKGKVTNPLAGIIRCGMCGGPIILKPQKSVPSALICPVVNCKNVGSYLYLVEEKLLAALRQWLESYKGRWESQEAIVDKDEQIRVEALKSTENGLRRKLAELEKQASSLDDLLEQKIYSVDKYLSRSKEIADRITEVKHGLKQADQDIKSEEIRKRSLEETIPNIEHVLNIYSHARDPQQQNNLLKSVLEQIVYMKEKGGRWSGAIDKFSLQLHPKLPR